MTQNIVGMQTVLDFVERCKDRGIMSTSCKLVNVYEALYNVEGSSSDPHINSKNWKPLLESYGISGSSKCYVTRENIDSHPGFNVGGHVTTNSNGAVQKGGTCYLMPECSWHNSKARDRTKFTLNKSVMLELYGYMTGELFTTFMLRLPSDEPYAILYHAGEDWNYQNLSEDQANNLSVEFLPSISRGGEINYVLLQRVHANETLHFIKKIHLPSAQSSLV